MSMYVLYNPLAGGGKNEQTVKSEEFFKKEGVVFEDMTKIDYKEFFGKIDPSDEIVLSGGDGTINRFVNDTDGIDVKNEIFYYAGGTGNDFFRDLDYKGDDKIVNITKYLKDLPVVTVNGVTKRFLNNVGFGIDGYCTEEGDKMREAGVENINYTSIAIKGLLMKFKPVNATITIDGVKREYKKVWLAPTMNGRYYGGGMMATPKQDRLNENHELSVLVFYGKGKVKTLIVFPSIFEGKHVDHKEMVEVLTGKDITVEFDRPTPLQIDGETISGVTKYHAKSAK